MLMQSVLGVLGVLLVAVPIQRGAGTGCPLSRTSSCSASGVECLFGSVPGCSVTCRNPSEAYCRKATCHFGFPKGPVCECLP